MLDDTADQSVGSARHGAVSGVHGELEMCVGIRTQRVVFFDSPTPFGRAVGVTRALRSDCLFLTNLSREAHVRYNTIERLLDLGVDALTTDQIASQQLGNNREGLGHVLVADGADGTALGERIKECLHAHARCGHARGALTGWLEFRVPFNVGADDDRSVVAYYACHYDLAGIILEALQEVDVLSDPVHELRVLARHAVGLGANLARVVWRALDAEFKAAERG